MNAIKITSLICALAIYLLVPLAHANQQLSAPLQGLVDRQLMGSLQTQTAMHAQGQMLALEQVGYGNSFYSLQQGSGNRIYAIQHGQGLSANVTQVGSDNVVQLAQYGEGSAIMVQQFGHQASVLIEQY